MTSSAHGTNSRVIPRDDGSPGWHVAAHLAGRNDLDVELARQARDLDAVGALDPAAVAVSVQVAGRESWQRVAGSHRSRRRPWDGDSGDARSLAAFAATAAAGDPERRLALVIASHGDGWSVAAGPGSLAYDRRTGSALSTPDLRRALATLHRARGRPLELLVLDACLMATVETVVEVADHVRFVVAPATRTGRVGADHAAVVRDIVGLVRRPHEEVRRDDVGPGRRWAGDRCGPEAVAAAWLARWRPPDAGRAGPTTVTVVATQGADALVGALDRLGAALADGWATGDAPPIEAARLDSARPAPGLTDLGSFAALVGDAPLRSSAATDIRAAAAEVRSVLRAGGPLVSATTLPGATRGRRAMGLAVTLGRGGRPEGYVPRKLAAARISGWCSFLDTLGRSPALPR